MALCDQASNDPAQLSHYWRCLPVPEQQVMHNLAQLLLAQTTIIPSATIRDNLIAQLAFPADQRTQIMLNNYRLVTTSTGLPECTEEYPCVILDLSAWVLELAGNLTNPFYSVGGTRCPPCYYAVNF